MRFGAMQDIKNQNQGIPHFGVPSKHSEPWRRFAATAGKPILYLLFC